MFMFLVLNDKQQKVPNLSLLFPLTKGTGWGGYHPILTITDGNIRNFET